MGVGYLWNDGPLRLGHVIDLVEIENLTRDLRDSDKLKEIKSSAESDRARQALNSFRSLDGKIRQIHQFQSTESYRSFELQQQKVNANLESLIGLPEASTLIQVLSRKVDSFEDFVTTNNWRTLTRISGRVSARLKFSDDERMSFFSERRLSQLHSAIVEDIERMRSVTSNSVLSQENKDRIISRIDSMSPELEMIGSYVEVIREFNQNIQGLEAEFMNWSDNVLLDLSDRRASFQQTSAIIFFGSLGFSAFLFLAFIAGQFVYSRNRTTALKRIDDYAMRTIRDGLIPLSPNPSFQNQISKDLASELEKFREYVHKRMSFGSVFQEGMPFSTIMLDNNLNLSWANGLFYDVWGLQERTAKEEPLSWDYLQQFTNLGEDDPVLMALNDNVAGIYQIQVRTKDDTEGLPYEMYVSPVDYCGQSRIMIFFYPLRSIQETISHQVRSIVGPVGRTLDLLACEEFRGEESKGLQKDFEIAGIDNLFEKFCSYDEIVTDQKQKLYGEIERLESELAKNRNFLREIGYLTDGQISLQNDLKKSFASTRDNIISMAENRELSDENFRKMAQHCREIFKEQQDVFSTCGRLADVLSDSMKGFEKISSISKDLKGRREELDHQRTRIIQSLEQTMVHQRMEKSDEKLSQNLNKIKSDVKTFDKILADLAKSITAVDVSMSRLEMMMNGVVIPDLKSKESWFEGMNEAIETEMFNAGKLEAESRSKEERMIEVLKEFYESFGKMTALMTEAKKVAQVVEQNDWDFSENNKSDESLEDEANHQSSEISMSMNSFDRPMV